MLELQMLLLSILLTGCHTATSVGISRAEILLENARIAFEEDQLYVAKAETQKILDLQPDHEAAGSLMAEIIDREISRQHELYDSKAIDEYSGQEKKDQAKTWLERAETLYSVRQYDEAVLAAERVFFYEPGNSQASRLIDKVKKAAIQEGKQESIILKKMYENEAGVRIKTYEEQAAKWFEAGRFGASRLAVEKILLLDPENPEALKLNEQIKAHTKA